MAPNRAGRRSRAAFASCVLFAAAIAHGRSLWANPFIGNSGSPALTPVQSGGPAPSSIVRGQLALRSRLAEYFSSWKAGSSPSILLVILGASFLYGTLHALGPGHRKTVVFAIYIARRAHWWEPIATSLALAGLHGGTAIALLLIFRGVAGAISASTDAISTYMEGFAYCTLIAVALFLLARAIVDLARGKSHEDSSLSLGALILTGVYPCPGAILVLVLSLSLDITGIGILAVLAMSLGMAIPITVFAYLGYLGRSGLLRRLKDNEAAMKRIGTIAEIAGFSILLAFAVYIALPFILGLSSLRS
jgi:nickel/cobalt transporter (NicO) family protein